MSDIFREVDEEFKRDQVAQTFKKHGNLIIGVLLAVVVAVGGYRTWQYLEAKKAAEAGQKFEVALALAADGKADEAKGLFESLAKDGPDGYRLLARFRLAAEQSRTDAPGAVKAFEALAADGKVEQTLRDLASVRAALLQIDTLPAAEIDAKLQAHAADGKPWRLAAREGIGLAAFRAGSLDKAGAAFERILADPEATQTARQRAEVMMALVRAGAPAK